ncbi:mdn1 [Symbiodinium sp. CCMP2592]|nr:mdn1 [Symbiodinium sp. CCMP2592]
MRSRLLVRFLAALLLTWPGLTFFGRRGQSSSDAVDALVKDLQALGSAGQDAANMASALLGGLQDSKLLADSSYDARRRVAKFKIAGGGATGEFFPDLRIWLQVQLDKNLRISWEKARSGAVVLHFSGLSFAPLPGAQELYLKAGLDSFTCPSIKSVNQEEYYQCHLKKALVMEEFWKANRTQIPKNLQHQFAFIGDNTVISHLSEQLGHGFGWSMLLVLSAPPSTVETLEFSENGVRGTSIHDKNQAGAKLSAKHGFKDLSLNIARPLVGDSRFGGFVRSVGERIMPVACNFGILCSVGEPRWRSKGIRGADPKVVASMFRRRGTKGPNGEEGCLTWKSKKRRLVRALQQPKAILLEGPPGLGKTATVQALAKATKRRLLRINLSEQTDLLDLLGSDLPMPGSEVAAFRWSDGALLRALKRGDWVLLDEINLAPQATLEGLNALLDHRREVFLPAIGQTVSAHAGFRLFAAQNPVATGGGRKGLPRSFLNRFTRVVLSQLSPEDLRHICEHAHGSALGKEVVDQTVRLVEELQLASQGASEEGGRPFEAQLDFDWNLRDALRLCELLRAKAPLAHHCQASAELLFVSRLRCDMDRDVARRVISRIFPPRPASFGAEREKDGAAADRKAIAQ